MNAPLSYSEQAAWNEFVCDPATFFKREAVLAVNLPAAVDADDAAAIAAVIGERHAILRTSYDAAAGQPVRRVSGRYPVELVWQDRAGPGAWPDQEHGACLTPADLVRTWLRPEPDGTLTLCFGLNEMITDPWSCARLSTEVLALAQGGAGLPPLPLTYAEFALAERERPVPPGLAGYWRRQLADIGQAGPGLPPDGPDPAGDEAAERIAILPDHRTATLREICRASRCSPFMVVTALVNLTLAALHGGRDIELATMVSARTGKWAQVHGNFSNVALLRTRLPDDPSFADVLASTKQTVLDALAAHQPAPYLQLADILGTPLPRPPLRVHYLPARAHHYSAELDQRPSGATWREETEFAGWPLDLGFAEDSRHRVAIWASYDPKVFSHAAVAGVVAGCGEVLELVTADAAAFDLPCSALGRRLGNAA